MPVTGDNVLGFRLQGGAHHVVVARVVLDDADSALAGGDDRRLADPLYELGDLCVSAREWFGTSVVSSMATACRLWLVACGSEGIASAPSASLRESNWALQDRRF